MNKEKSFEKYMNKRVEARKNGTHVQYKEVGEVMKSKAKALKKYE